MSLGSRNCYMIKEPVHIWGEDFITVIFTLYYRILLTMTRQRQGARWSFATHSCNLQTTKRSTLTIPTKRRVQKCVLRTTLKINSNPASPVFVSRRPCILQTPPKSLLCASSIESIIWLPWLNSLPVVSTSPCLSEDWSTQRRMNQQLQGE